MKESIDVRSDDSTNTPGSLAEQRALWRKQAASLPSLRGGKNLWVPLTLELVEQIGAGKAIEPAGYPDFPPALFAAAPRQGGAAPLTQPLTWLEYGKFVKGAGLAYAENAELKLTPQGRLVHSNPTPGQLAEVLISRFRLFTEALSLVAEKDSTVEEVDGHLRDRYETTWKSLGGVRSRMDWLEVLGLIEGRGNRHWGITAAGETLLARSTIVSPEAITFRTAHVEPITEAPGEIKTLLGQLSTSERPQDSRSTYNIWVPSPASNPNKVANLRTIVNAAIDPIKREELLRFIADSFELRRTSVDSMMPFLRASGLLHEVGLGIYQATAPARAWVTSEDDVNFIRILHANMRFVGEMIQTVEAGVTRTEMYREAAKHGLNVDKSRWIASFLEDTALIEQPRYGSLRATATGITLLAELPLAEPPTPLERPEVSSATPRRANQEDHPSLKEELTTFSRSPQALGLGSGKAFERSVRDAFRALGFRAETISGSSDTDVVVRWQDETDTEVVAIVEAKSRSNGYVTHSDFSDIALETHRSQHKAHFAALVGPAFHGDTIKNMAAKRGWAMVEAGRLGEIVEAATELGLGPTETGILFKVPDGFDELDRIIGQRRRELSVLSFVVAQLAEEAADTGDAITARDISRDGRRTDLTPTVEEVQAAFLSLSQVEVGAIRLVQQQQDPKFSTYTLGYVRSAAMRLRAVASAIESALPSTRHD
ncbi:hypothetical protein ACFWMR_24480 [Amycolatopsis thailandensis]|uniref:hypothetical protein n=1 Tax=Amycolatopsis thailandensis TaxID=589330 RepID=UPI00364CE045